MATHSWGGSVNSTAMYTGNLPYIYTASIGMPAGNLAANGTRPIQIWSIGGAYGTNVDWKVDYGAWYDDWAIFSSTGGAFNFIAARTGGYMYVGRNTTAGGTTYWSDGDSLSGQMPGSFSWATVPSAPQSLTGSPHASSSGSVNLSWSVPVGTGSPGAPAGNGDSAITGYRVYDGGGTLIGSPTGTSFTATGLTPGTSYSFTVRAVNAIATSAGTQSVNSNSVSVVAPGAPNAPTGLSATPSTTVTGRIALSWTAPSVPGAGGITGYNIYRDGSLHATTTGTATTYAVTGLTPYTSYSFTVRARNAFADSTSTTGTASSAASAVAPGPPGAPTGLNATPDMLNPGKIDLAWTAPAQTGTGGITGYNIYFSGGALIFSTTGTGTTYSVTGLNPGQTYSFNVAARNALADAEGSTSARSADVVATALGEPAAPTGVTVVPASAVANRLVVSWTAPAGILTGFNIFERNTTTSVDTLVGTVASGVTSYRVDGVPSGTTRTYVVRARNSYTDTLSMGYPGNWGGPASAQASGTASSNSSQSVASLTITDTTNQTFNGTYTLVAITPTAISYSKTAANIALATVAAGTVVNNTNVTFNGTYTVSTPSSTTISYAKTASNIPGTAVTTGTITDLTNQSFNGTFTVTSVNVGAKTVTYPRVGSVVATVAVPINVLPGASSSITNQTNVVYNVSGVTILSTPSPSQLTYARTNANLAESNAAGVAVDVTNRDVFNGIYAVSGIPTHNVFSYTRTASNVSLRTIDTPYGKVFRTTSPAEVDVKYRSGWAG